MYSSILLPIDLGHESSWKKTLPTALALAGTFSAKLHIACVIPDFGMSMVSVNFPPDYEEKRFAETHEALQDFVKQHVPPGQTCQVHVANGTIYSEIISVAKKLSCDLIVISSHRPEMKDYLLGPNASRVVRHAKISVFVVRE